MIPRHNSRAPPAVARAPGPTPTAARLFFLVAAACLAPAVSFSPTASPTGRTGPARLNMFPPAGGAPAPSDTALRSAALNFQGSPWTRAPAAPVGLLHPDTMNLLVRAFGRPAFESDPAMSAFLSDYESGGPMSCMHHLSNSDVTARLVSMTAEINAH